MITGTILKTPRLIPNSEQTRYVKYRLTFKGADANELIPSDNRQTVQADAGQGSAIMVVQSMGRSMGRPARPRSTPNT